MKAGSVTVGCYRSNMVSAIGCYALPGFGRGSTGFRSCLRLVAKRFAPAWFRRGDYLNPSEPDLKKAVSNLVCEKIGHRPIDRICLLTQIRCLGFVFNPVSIYYCFGTNGLEAIVAEVTNTPWGERHAYVLDCRQQLETDWFLFGKAFHVSPFMPMKSFINGNLKHQGSQLMVRMENLQSGARLFQANLDLNRRPLTAKVLRRMWWRHR